jgi:hypothetical protein
VRWRRKALEIVVCHYEENAIWQIKECKNGEARIQTVYVWNFLNEIRDFTRFGKYQLSTLMSPSVYIAWWGVVTVPWVSHTTWPTSLLKIPPDLVKVWPSQSSILTPRNRNDPNSYAVEIEPPLIIIAMISLHATKYLFRARYTFSNFQFHANCVH